MAIKAKITVKNESVLAFLKTYSHNFIEYNQTQAHLGGYSGTNSIIFQQLQHTIFFKKDLGINIGDYINIQLKDMLHNSGLQVNVNYLYVAEKYDDVSIKMVLKTKTTSDLIE